MFQRAALLVPLLILSLASAPAVRAQQESGITVMGEGRVLASPDLARVVFGVEQIDPSLEQALANASAAMNRVIDRLVQLGVAREDIQTIRFSVSPVYDGRGDNPILRGYRVSNAVSATLRDLSQVGTIIDQAVAAGATRVEGISFDSSHRPQLQDQAREQAVANARARAQQLAALTGVNLGPVIMIEDVNTGGAVPVRAAAAPVAAEATPIEGGQLEIRATVRVTWAIE